MSFASGSFRIGVASILQRLRIRMKASGTIVRNIRNNSIKNCPINAALLYQESRVTIKPFPDNLRPGKDGKEINTTGQEISFG